MGENSGLVGKIVKAGALVVAGVGIGLLMNRDKSLSVAEELISKGKYEAAAQVLETSEKNTAHKFYLQGMVELNKEIKDIRKERLINFLILHQVWMMGIKKKKYQKPILNQDM